ncbi:exo-rhamnogalacturonan lyase family protein [Portibacter lacus]|uniref:Tat pathway signal sequence domain protein n=1 Tax=Portibacter lacus TaxID=1099794 RepID=A0AA37ST54_9BACT|nr:hypothetical protein [Portibacter lacus]GLR19607.1 hypothetical protein GCM10007940_42230 [Portibacter lacus]
MSKNSFYQNKAWSIVIILAHFIAFNSLFVPMVNAQVDTPVELKWLGDEKPNITTGVSWGVPFEKGTVPVDSDYSLKDSNGNSMMVQSWPLAYWPDGSMKWVGLSTVIEKGSGTTFQLQPTNNSNHPNEEIQVTEAENVVLINTGVLQCEIPRQGSKIINSIKINNLEVSSGGELVCILQDGPAQEFGAQPTKEKFIGNIEKVTVEQSGPVRSVVKIEGNHISTSGNREFLPFIIRMYFYSGQQTVKMVHTIIYDGDQNKDFIRGLGVVFDVPMDEEIQNRHIRFSGEDGGFWSEPIQPMVGRRQLADKEMYARQLRGERVPQQETFSEREQSFLDHWASWNDFKLFQGNADGFSVRKRINDQSAWIDAGAGGRSSGLVFAGDVSGGLAVCIRNFWQSFPAALEVRDAKTEKAKLKAWFWSPDGPEMDMRHYDTLAWGHGLEASYEDVQPGLSTPTGVARTSEILLFASSDVPTIETLNALVEVGNDPPLLVASPEYIHSIPVFGAWSLPDRSTKGKQWIEHQLDNAFKYYQLEVEQRKWYGYWDYGDVMHAYDEERHVWKYDVGGYAWDNSELVPNMWLWYSFLRSGSEDIFRMAEAMTRHTGEVDVYHLGRLAGLGSRHNVRHWGGGAKEVRISQAALSRFYYYLTSDERTGDLMRESVEASNTAIGELDPLRLILDKSKYPTHARMGPDWIALVGNWMTEWERTGDDQYRDRILTGVNSLYEMPYGLFSGKGAAMGYDPATFKLYQLDKNDIGYSHLSVLMGGPEIAFELTPLLENEKWDKLWLQFCKLYGQPADVVEKEFGRRAKLGDPELWYARLPAYYANSTGEADWAVKAWSDFLKKSNWENIYTHFNMELVDEPGMLRPVYEVKGVSTNNTAQWCLNAIELLGLVGDQLPEDHPLFSQKLNHSKN